jgi:hypothetical protein
MRSSAMGTRPSGRQVALLFCAHGHGLAEKPGACHGCGSCLRTRRLKRLVLGALAELIRMRVLGVSRNPLCAVFSEVFENKVVVVRRSSRPVEFLSAITDQMRLVLAPGGFRLGVKRMLLHGEIVSHKRPSRRLCSNWTMIMRFLVKNCRIKSLGARL